MSEREKERGGRGIGRQREGGKRRKNERDNREKKETKNERPLRNSS